MRKRPIWSREQTMKNERYDSLFNTIEDWPFGSH
jgi:hypothetical protein